MPGAAAGRATRPGTYRPPDAATRWSGSIAADDARYVGHYADRPRHTQQVDYFVYEHDLRKRELPAGRARARALGRVDLTRPAAQQA